MKQRLYKIKNIILLPLLCLAVAVWPLGRMFPVSAYASSEDSDPVRDEYERRLKEAQEQKNAIEQKKKETQAIIKQLKSETDDILGYIEALDNQLAENMLYVESLQAQIIDAQAELEQTRFALSEAEDTARKQYSIMKNRIVNMYENGADSIIDYILRSESIADIMNQAEYFTKVADYDNDLFDRYTETVKQITAQEALQQIGIERLDGLVEAAEFEQHSLGEMLTDKNKKLTEYMILTDTNEDLLSDYFEQIEDVSGDIEQIVADEQERIRIAEEKRLAEESRLKAEQEERERLAREEAERAAQEQQEQQQGQQEPTSAGQNPIDATKVEDIIWPLPGDGGIYSWFGPRKAPTVGASTYHKGLDIGGKYGADIVSALAGTVETVDYSATSGNYIIVNHGDGLKTAYLHCSKTLVEEGEYVLQDTIIALVGQTGVATGPHLHFGMQVNGTYIDPYPYLEHVRP